MSYCFPFLGFYLDMFGILKEVSIQIFISKWFEVFKGWLVSKRIHQSS